jgi:hypothetical protein
MTPALYELAHEYKTLLSVLADGDFDAATVADTLESSGLSDEITVKAQGIECVARALEMHSPYRQAEIKRLQALDAADMKKAHALREYLKYHMQACGITRIESALFKIRLQNNPPAVEIYEPGLIPAEFMTQPLPPAPVPDKTALKAALKAGIEVQGCRLTTGVSLRIS